MTSSMSPAELEVFVKSTGHQLNVLEFDDTPAVEDDDR